jgi:hypothetical protein
MKIKHDDHDAWSILHLNPVISTVIPAQAGIRQTDQDPDFPSLAGCPPSRA